MEAQRQEAIQILNEEGFDFDKTYLFTVESDAQVAARATFVQEQLRLLGIKTDFDQVETVAYRQQEATGTWGDILPGNATMPTDDPALGMGSYFRCDSTGNNWTPGSDCDQEMETLLDQALSEADPVKRREISDKIQLKAMREYWKFPCTGSRRRCPSGLRSGATSITPSPPVLILITSKCGLTRPTRTTRAMPVRPAACLEASSLPRHRGVGM